MVEILLPNSDAKAVPNSGYTALMLAAKYGSVEMVKRLLPKSDPKATNWRKDTAYDVAKKYHRNQILRLLQQFQVSLISEVFFYILVEQNGPVQTPYVLLLI